MFRRVDPLESIDAQLRDLVMRIRECTDPDSAEVLKLLWRADLLLDRRLQLRPQERV
jgi:hypothetical protein